MPPTARPSRRLYCANQAERLGEPLAGSASEDARWLLIEQPGPWDRQALTGSDLPADVAQALARAEEEHGIKVHLIRRTAARPEIECPRACFLVSTERGNSWMERHPLERPEQVLDLDLAAFGAGRPTDPAAAWREPVYAVCTHGRRDPCCAERGRPLRRAFAAHRDDQTWESAHLGGHRFSPTMVAFPYGLCYGQVPAARALELAEAHERGEVLVELLRGRVGDARPVQVADAAVRASEGLRGVSDVEVLRWTERASNRASVWLMAGGRVLRADVRWIPTGRPRPVSCNAAQAEDPGMGVLEALTPLG